MIYVCADERDMSLTKKAQVGERWGAAKVRPVHGGKRYCFEFEEGEERHTRSRSRTFTDSRSRTIFTRGWYSLENVATKGSSQLVEERREVLLVGRNRI